MLKKDIFNILFKKDVEYTFQLYCTYLVLQVLQKIKDKKISFWLYSQDIKKQKKQKMNKTYQILKFIWSNIQKQVKRSSTARTSTKQSLATLYGFLFSAFRLQKQWKFSVSFP